MNARLWCMGVLMLIVVIESIWIFRLSSTSMVTFDVKRIRGQFIHQLAMHHASDEVVQTSNVHFNQALQRALDRYAKNHHVVILPREEVLSGGKDVTDAIIPEVSSLMRGSL